jgi:hypothetical protein
VKYPSGSASASRSWLTCGLPSVGVALAELRDVDHRGDGHVGLQAVGDGLDGRVQRQDLRAVVGQRGGEGAVDGVGRRDRGVDVGGQRGGQGLSAVAAEQVLEAGLAAAGRAAQVDEAQPLEVGDDVLAAVVGKHRLAQLGRAVFGGAGGVDAERHGELVVFELQVRVEHGRVDRVDGGLDRVVGRGAGARAGQLRPEVAGCGVPGGRERLGGRDHALADDAGVVGAALVELGGRDRGPEAVFVDAGGLGAGVAGLRVKQQVLEGVEAVDVDELLADEVRRGVGLRCELLVDGARVDGRPRVDLVAQAHAPRARRQGGGPELEELGALPRDHRRPPRGARGVGAGGRVRGQRLVQRLGGGHEVVERRHDDAAGEGTQHGGARRAPACAVLAVRRAAGGVALAGEQRGHEGQRQRASGESTGGRGHGLVLRRRPRPVARGDWGRTPTPGAAVRRRVRRCG